MIKRKSARCKSLVVFFCFAVFVSCFAHAPEAVAHDPPEEPNVLVIYSSKDGKVDEYQRTLDMIIGHFTTKITFTSSDDVKQDDLIGVIRTFEINENR